MNYSKKRKLQKEKIIMQSKEKRNILEILLCIIIPIGAYLLLYAANFLVQNIAYIIICANLPQKANVYEFQKEAMRIFMSHTSLLYILASILFLLVLLLIYKTTKLIQFSGIQKRKLPQNGVMNIIAVGLILGVLLNVLLNVMENIIPAEWLKANQESVGAFQGEHILITLCAVSVFAPIVEELLFRGFLYNCMKKLTGQIWISSIITSVLFGVYHGNILQAIYAGALSFIMIWFYEKSQSLAASIIFHGAVNASSMFAVVLMFYNMEIAVLIICPIVGIFLMYMFSKKCKERQIKDNEALQPESSGGNQ